MFRGCGAESQDQVADFLSANGFINGINDYNWHGILPIHAALLCGKGGNPQGLEMLKELLQRGANPLLESADHFKINAAGLAAMYGLADEWDVLIKKCPSAATALTGGNQLPTMSPFAHAIMQYSNHPEKTIAFFDRFKHLVPDLDVNLPGQDVPPIVFAAINNQTEATRYFINAGVSLTSGPNVGWNVAHWAAAFGCFGSFVGICNLKPELAVSLTQNSDQWNPLTVAAVYAKIRPACSDFIARLVDQEYGVDMRNGSLDTPLMISAWVMQSLNGVKALLAAGADADLKYFPLVANHPNTSKTAFVLGAQLKINGANALAVQAAEETRGDILVELVNSSKFHVANNGYGGFSAFSWAMETCNIKVLDAIEAKEPQDLEVRDLTGSTYLQWAVEIQAYSFGVCKWLVDHGSDVNALYIKTSSGLNRTAFTDICEQVCMSAHVDVKTQMEKAQYILNSSRFNIKYVDDQGFTALHWAISLKDAKIVHDICTKDISLVNVKDMYNKTALKWASEYYNAADKALWKDVITELVIHGANTEDLVGTDLLGHDFGADHALLEARYVSLGGAVHE